MNCTLDDYGKFLNVFATGAHALVKPETMTWLTTPSSNGYAGGWMTIALPNGTLLAHSGSNTMWYATALVSSAKRTAFAFVTNKGEPKLEDHLERLIRAVAK